MITTLDRLILAQVVYEDLSKVLELESFNKDHKDWIEVVNETLNKFNDPANGGDNITREDIEATLSKFVLINTVDTMEDPADGFYAAAFREISGDNELTIAIRGSLPPEELIESPEGFGDDWIETNLGELPLDYGDVSEFTRLASLETFYNESIAIGNYDDVSLSGHSMGGALAQRLAVDLINNGVAVICETFNAPGMLHSLSVDMMAKAKNGDYDDIVNYVNKDDSLVGTLDLTISGLTGLAIANVGALLAPILLNAVVNGNDYYIAVEAIEDYFDISLNNAVDDLSVALDNYLEDPTYRDSLFKHIGVTNYVHGEEIGQVTEEVSIIHGGKEYIINVTSEEHDTHGLFNFLKDIDDDGKLISSTGLSMTLSDGFDNIIGSEQVDIISAAGGNDVLNSKGGDDILYGDSGNDTLIGGSGKDILNGGTGIDTYIFNEGDGHDEIIEGTGEYLENNIVLNDRATEDIYFTLDMNESTYRYDNLNIIMYMLFNDNEITHDKFIKSLYSSNSNDHIKHHFLASINIGE